MADGARMFKVAANAGRRLGERIIESKKNEGVGFGNKEATRKEWIAQYRTSPSFRKQTVVF